MRNSILIKQIFKTLFSCIFVCKSLRYNTCLDIHFQKFSSPCFLGIIAKYTQSNFSTGTKALEIRKKWQIQFHFPYHLFFAILSKYSYYEHVIRLPTKKCVVMLSKQSHRLCTILFPRNKSEFSKNMSHGYFWFTFTQSLKVSEP